MGNGGGAALHVRSNGGAHNVKDLAQLCIDVVHHLLKHLGAPGDVSVDHVLEKRDELKKTLQAAAHIGHISSHAKKRKGDFKNVVAVVIVVFEYLFGARDVEGRPLLMFVAGLIYSLISVPLALYFRSDAASSLAVSLTTIAAVPLILRIIDFEADMLDLYPGSVITREIRVIGLFMWFFFGLVAGYTIAYLSVGPAQFQRVASLQLSDIAFAISVRSAITGNALFPGPMGPIFWHNLRVYVTGIVLSFIYGTGGVFILSWNASVVSALLASQIYSTGSVISGIARFLGILPHGIIEYSAYIIGGFAAALISLVILQRGWNRQLMLDAIIFMLSGIVLLYIAAAVESTLIIAAG